MKGEWELSVILEEKRVLVMRVNEKKIIVKNDSYKYKLLDLMLKLKKGKTTEQVGLLP